MTAEKAEVESKLFQEAASTGLLEARGDGEYYTNIYLRSDVLATSTDDITILEVTSMNAPEGQIYPEQRSYFCSLVWCERGGFVFNGRGWSLDVKAGEVAVLDTGIHFSATAGKDGAEGYYLLMDGPHCHQLLKKSHLWQGAFRCPEIPRDWLDMAAAGLIRKGRQAMASHIGYQIFLQVGQQVDESFPHPLLWKACLYMQTDWGNEKLNVEAILAHADVSRSKLSALFKEHLGVSILQYLNGVRLGHAKRLLTDGVEPISEIATACGLRDASYFSSWFRKQTGMTPSRFREGG